MGSEPVRSFRGPRTEVWTVDELLPRRMLPLSVFNAWVNPRRPYPPIRGWVMQQIVKFGAAAELGVDLLVLADSDVVLVRPVTIDTFRNDGRVRFYRSEGAVDERLPRHLLWHEVARKLLGLPAEPAPLPDYITAFNVWDRRVVLALRERIEAVTGRPWLDAIASQLHVSEFILYGVFVDEVLGASAPVIPEDSMLCHSHWGPEPMADASVPAFVRSLQTGGRCGNDLRTLGNRAGCATKGAVQRSLQRRPWELRCGISARRASIASSKTWSRRSVGRQKILGRSFVHRAGQKFDERFGANGSSQR